MTNPTNQFPSLPSGADLLPLAEAIVTYDPHTQPRPHIWVAGEISDVHRASSGHVYFTVSDGAVHLPCVLWERVARGIAACPEDGLGIAIYGWIQTHPHRGHLEMDVRGLIVQATQGPRQRAANELQARLKAEGLLDAARKRPLPLEPRAVGVVTSPTGDVIHDIRRVLQRRAPGVPIELAPARVSGAGAATEIATAIRSLSDSPSVGVIIVARGGGTAADLAAYDSEIVARAIADSAVPVITGLGHAPDVSLADLVADIHCATPSEAAEIAVPVRSAAASAAPSAFLDGAAHLRLQVGPVSITIQI